MLKALRAMWSGACLSQRDAENKKRRQSAGAYHNDFMHEEQEIYNHQGEMDYDEEPRTMMTSWAKRLHGTKKPGQLYLTSQTMPRSSPTSRKLGQGSYFERLLPRRESEPGGPHCKDMSAATWLRIQRQRARRQWIVCQLHRLHDRPR